MLRPLSHDCRSGPIWETRGRLFRSTSPACGDRQTAALSVERRHTSASLNISFSTPGHLTSPAGAGTQRRQGPQCLTPSNHERKLEAVLQLSPCKSSFITLSVKGAVGSAGPIFRGQAVLQHQFILNGTRFWFFGIICSDRLAHGCTDLLQERHLTRPKARLEVV